MPEITLKIENEVGLHARPASEFVKTASQFESEIAVVFGDRSANGKSILSVLTLGANKGAELKISAEGKDEKEALEAIEILVRSNFGEDE